MKENMWIAIESLGWRVNGYDYKKIAKNLFTRYTEPQRKEIRRFVSQAIQSLSERIKSFEASERPLDIGSDDGMSDVLHHIVGLGCDEWLRCLNDPTLIEKRYNSKYGSDEGYKESFAYCFHEPDLEPPHTVVQSQNVVHKITPGFVTQIFDTVTGQFVSQNFTAGSQVDYEDQFGNTVSPEVLKSHNFSPTSAEKQPYLPFDMVQPLSIKNCQESIQEDLLALMDGLPDEAQTHACEIVVENFKKYFQKS